MQKHEDIQKAQLASKAAGKLAQQARQVAQQAANARKDAKNRPHDSRPGSVAIWNI